MPATRLRSSIFILAALLISVSTMAAQQQEKRPVPIEEYARYRSITSVSISDDGQWISYAYRKREADDSLYVSNPETGAELLTLSGHGHRTYPRD